MTINVCQRQAEAFAHVIAVAITEQGLCGCISLFGVRGSGGISAAYLVQSALHKLNGFDSAEIIDDVYAADVIIDAVINNGVTRDWHNAKTGAPFYALVNRQTMGAYKGHQPKFPWDI